MNPSDWPTSRREMHDLPPETFEEFVADVWTARGYDASATQLSNDAGKDVIAEKDGRQVAIQAKRYQQSNRVGGPEIQQYGSILHDEAIDGVVIATSSTFTNAAYRRGQEIGVELVDGERLLTLADRYRGGDTTPSSSSSSSSGGVGSGFLKLFLLPVQVLLVWFALVWKLMLGYLKVLYLVFTWPLR